MIFYTIAVLARQSRRVRLDCLSCLNANIRARVSSSESLFLLAHDAQSVADEAWRMIGKVDNGSTGLARWPPLAALWGVGQSERRSSPRTVGAGWMSMRRWMTGFHPLHHDHPARRAKAMPKEALKEAAGRGWRTVMAVVWT